MENKNLLDKLNELQETLQETNSITEKSKLDIISKINNLTPAQTEFLARFLNKPQEFADSTKDDIVILSDLLSNIRNSLAYVNRKQRGSVEAAIYGKYLLQEKEIELDLYKHLKSFGVQLRRGGYDSSTCKKDALNLTTNEIAILDSIFPENKKSGNDITIPLPNMTLAELQIADLRASERHKALRAQEVKTALKKVGRIRKNNSSIRKKDKKKKA
jgi:hypothetical protein